MVREDPDAAGLLYAGTEFGIYVSFDNGGHWQSFQLNLPVTPVTDIKMAHKDLMLSTQGRSLLDSGQSDAAASIEQKVAGSTAYLFAPREAVRTPGGRGGGGGLNPSQLRVSVAGRDDRLLSGERASGTVSHGDSRCVGEDGSYDFKRRRWAGAAEDADAGRRREEGGGFARRGAAGEARKPGDASVSPGICAIRRPWKSATRPEGPNGPAAVPGKYAVKLNGRVVDVDAAVHA